MQQTQHHTTEETSGDHGMIIIMLTMRIMERCNITVNSLQYLTQYK